MVSLTLSVIAVMAAVLLSEEHQSSSLLVQSFSFQQQMIAVTRRSSSSSTLLLSATTRSITRSASNSTSNNDSNSSSTSCVNNVNLFRTSCVSTSLSKFEKFDYLSHWYPVVWARDLELDKLTKVTVFDVDYVVAKISSTSNSSNSRQNTNEEDVEVVAMVDYCTHKGAALSEGRITKSCSSRSFQCTYHGWLFDPRTGECIDIPQVEVGDADANIANTSMRKKRNGMRDTKTNGKAVPAMIDENGMVWIFPGGGLEKALLHPPPPVDMIIEIGKDDFRPVIQVVRDCPIDWTIVLENLMDPDHGLFAHQETVFDLYSASKNNPVSIREQELDNGKGWTITSQVDGKYELLKRNEEQIMTESKSQGREKKRKFDGGKHTRGNANDVPKSTVTFVAPNMVFMAQRDKNGETRFEICFFVTPTGAGKSRLMVCVIIKAPKWLKVPRFVQHVIANNFIDQDMYLLATQQRHILATESQLVINSKNDKNHKKDGTTIIPVRKNMYTYRSPTERLGVRVGTFFDATVSRVPNRLSKIRNYGGYDNALEKMSTTRREVLDRKQQHTLICKDSMGFVKNCQKLRSALKVIALAPILLRVLTTGVNSGGSSVSSAGGMKLLSSSILLKVNRIFLSPSSILLIWTVSFAIYFVAMKLEKEFEYKYTEEFRDKDYDKIPSLWMDLF